MGRRGFGRRGIRDDGHRWILEPSKDRLVWRGCPAKWSVYNPTPSGYRNRGHPFWCLILEEVHSKERAILGGLGHLRKKSGRRRVVSPPLLQVQFGCYTWDALWRLGRFGSHAATNGVGMFNGTTSKLAGNEAANFLYPGKPNRNDKVVMEANRFKSIAGVFLLVSGH